MKEDHRKFDPERMLICGLMAGTMATALVLSLIFFLGMDLKAVDGKGLFLTILFLSLSLWCLIGRGKD